MTAKEEQVLLLALQHRDRVRRIRISDTSLYSEFPKLVTPISNTCDDDSAQARRSQSPQEADRTQWRELLMLFNKANIIRVDSELTRELSRSLQFDDGESPMELLPELKALESAARLFDADAFASFLAS
ncbi:hypothetical protein F5148DRAFT_1286620 [Russula earlei]|uniref:Uncharacterized protein n=1 Tax=Russula earlei TaxID=71964 RepID=A0ACC0U444_9AGAM|nr:hypothetical protein F5148DRAFT_1286620 [Russula earlei]